MRPVYGDQEPLHLAAGLPAVLGGEDPLQGISAYRVEDPEPHWHFVTYGFTELYDKEFEDSSLSGFGFELTFRLVGDMAQDPPPWVFSFLQNLARYVFSSGNQLAQGHYLDLNGPIALGSETAIRAVVFSPDPVLGKIESPHGDVSFLQAVGITLDELLAIKRWDATLFLGLLTEHLPYALTNLSRSSLLETPDIREALTSGAAQDGSSTATLYVSVMHWTASSSDAQITLGAKGVPDLGALLPTRIPFGRELSIFAPEDSVVFEPGDAFGFREKREGELRYLSVTLPSDVASDLANALEPKQGIYRVPSAPGLTIRVERSHIKGPDGEVREIIG